MKVWALTIFLILTGCFFKEDDYIPVQEETISIPGYTSEELAEFKRQHGTDFDPNSRVSREKMAVIQGKPTPKPSPKPPISPVEPSKPDLSVPIRERVISVANGLLGMRETNGKNRSPKIDAMNRFVGAPLGSPWCASFNAWIYKEAGVKGFPKSAWSPDWVRSPTWTRKSGGRVPLPGDAFGIWFSSKNRIAHTGLVEKWGNSVTTIEGNTGPSGTVPGSAGDRDGDGSYKKFRLKTQIYSVRDWINESK
jgi:hypothetical protein